MVRNSNIKIWCFRLEARIAKLNWETTTTLLSVLPGLLRPPPRWYYSVSKGGHREHFKSWRLHADCRRDFQRMKSLSKIWWKVKFNERYRNVDIFNYPTYISGNQWGGKPGSRRRQQEQVKLPLLELANMSVMLCGLTLTFILALPILGPS